MRFWFPVESDLHKGSTKALKVLISFTSTYLCECGFSALTLIKNKYRSRLQVEDDLRLFLSAVQPRIEQLCASKARPHCSHWYGRLNWKSKLCRLECISWLGHRADAARSANYVNLAHFVCCWSLRIYVAEIVNKFPSSPSKVRWRPRHTAPISAIGCRWL